MPLCQCRDITKNREIRFTQSPAGIDQVKKAVQLLTDITGIELAAPARPYVLQVRYDVREITLQMLESALIDIDFSLHNNLHIRFKRGLIAYCEDALRSSLGIESDQQASLTLSKTSPHHQNLDHRPDNWRNYV